MFKRIFGVLALLALLALLWLRFYLPKARFIATATPQLSQAVPASAVAPAYTALPGSLIPLNVLKTKIVREELTPEELAAPMPFRVALRMRNIDELRARIAKGEILSQAEMSAKYYPTQENFDQVSSWLSAHGLKVQPADITRLSVAANGSTAIVAQTLQTKFVRVDGIDGREYTSASSAPSMPSVFAPFVLGVNGLQPEIKAFIRHAQNLPVGGNGLYTVGPQVISQHYGVPTGLDGTGQTIALIGAENPASSDVTAFWQNTGASSQSFASVVTVVNPWGNSLDGGGNNNVELTMDLEWASGIAPGAKFRIYQSLDAYQFVPAILSDLQSIPSLKQASYSGGFPEFSGEALIESDSQYYAALAAAGVTFFASTGDWGQYSAPGKSAGSTMVTVSYPASDPCVTAVGGTTLQFASATPPTAQPTPDIPTGVEYGWGQSGGGQSVNFERPSWQTGSGVPTGSGRLVPDVSAVASTLTNSTSTSRNLYLFYGGNTASAAGTSVSSPIWAGLCAIINQSRANAGLQPIGLLGPRIYPLIGTTAFTDITSDDSLSTSYQGATVAGVGYDTCTGIGAPNVGNLITALATAPNSQTALPQIVNQTSDQYVVSGGNATLSVTAVTPSGAPILSYQWRATDPNVSWYPGIDNGNSAWLPLSDGAGISGSQTSMLTLSNLTTANTLDKSGGLRRYDCVVQNQYGFTYSTAVTITVGNTAPAITTALTNQTVAIGDTVSFAAEVTGNTPVTYQWQLSTNGGSTWTNLTDGGDYSGSASSALKITGATAGLNGNQFRYVATNSAGTTMSAAAALTVTSPVFPSPTGVAIDSSGNLYICDSSNNTVQKVTSLLLASIVAGTSGQAGSTDGSGTSALFRQPGGITIDGSGNLYVADTGNSTIRKITPAGAVTTFAGSPSHQGYQEGTGVNAWFNSPTGIAVDSSGNLFVADTGNAIIRKLTPSGASSTIAGSAGATGTTDGVGAAARFNHPSSLALDSFGNVYVTDTFNDTIREITSANAVTTLAGTPGVSGTYDGPGTALALFNQPAGIAVDSSNNIYIADTGNATIRKSALYGNVSTLAGLASIAGLEDDADGDALFNQPRGLAIDASGNVLVADTGNAAIRKVSPIGIVTTLAITIANAPVITAQPTSASVPAGTNATFSAAASGNPNPQFQWQRLPAGSTTWSNLTDGGNYSGTSTATLTVSSTTTGMNSDQFRTLVTNSIASATSNAATLTISSSSSSTANASGGGGGATSLWFYAALGLLATVRFISHKFCSPAGRRS